MLYTIINHIKNSNFLTPFFLGALVCSLVGGFFHLVLIFSVIWLSTALINRIYRPIPMTV